MLFSESHRRANVAPGASSSPGEKGRSLAEAGGGRHGEDDGACTLTLELASTWTLCRARLPWPLVIPHAEVRGGHLGRSGVRLLEISQQLIEKKLVTCFTHDREAILWGPLARIGDLLWFWCHLIHSQHAWESHENRGIGGRVAKRF